MIVVALPELALPLDECAAVLAPLLGCTLYESRLRLSAGIPAVVLTTADPARAQAIAAALQQRGQRALVCDASSAVSSRAMVPMKRFQLASDAIVGGAQNEQTLPYADILAIFRALHREQIDASTLSKSTTFSAGRAVLTGGLVMTKSQTTAAQKTSEAQEQVLYLFRRSGQTPWLLQESQTQYQGLGARLQPTTTANFQATLQLLREKAPGAVYDERLMKVRKMVEQAVRGTAGGNLQVTSSTASSTDLYAHLMALALAGA